ncbi:hypothetical protein E3A20_18590 [Planctomyces bekefii]|uniref:Uncharacterized protein n=1 Tax=Planctomyces bekefii TaxID=1653850 RepID=A0A5C6M4V7_9PLAN|nr:hypothetical protein E3A20_18590 [Planctomyces bekefii]
MRSDANLGISIGNHRAVVLGAACGYSSQQLLPFVRSVQQAIPGAATVLFVDPLTVPDLSGVHVVSRRDCALRNRVRRLSRGRRLASQLLLTAGCGLQLVSGRTNVLLEAAFGVAVARYFWYRDFLRRHPGPGDQHIMLSDTRNVLLQGDPFTGLPKGRMFCGVEPVAMGSCSANSLWYGRAYGQAALSRIAMSEVLCSGVSGGPRELMKKYLDCMCREILRVGPKILWAAGYDQAVHNYLLRNTDLGQDFVFESWDSDRLTTLHYASDCGFVVNSSGRLCGPSGSPVAIVHQFDRHDRLQKWANSFGAGLLTSEKHGR